MSSERRPRGVLVTRLDFTELTWAVRTRYAIPADATVSLGYDYGLGRYGGRTYVICSEGVGWDVTTEPLRLGVYVATPGHMAIAPEYRITLEPHEIGEHERPDEPVDLADLVRAFGSRLEVNFWLWYRRLTGAA